MAPIGSSPEAPIAESVHAQGQPDHNQPSFVVITRVETGTLIGSDGAGGEWFGDDFAKSCGCRCSQLVRLDESTHAIDRFTFRSHGTQFGAGGRGVNPNAMLLTYFGASNSGIGYIDLQSQKITKYGFNAEGFNDIVAGPDNSMWFTYLDGDEQGRIGQIDATTKKIHVYSAPRGHTPDRIVLGSDGALWFTRTAIGRFDASTHHFSEYPITMGPPI